MLRVLDLFSGIGGFSLGLERTGGFEAVAFCELDSFCRRVLAKHWPGVPCHDDVTTFHPTGHVDVVTGGFPCQDISAANHNGRGIDGERSGLAFELTRIVGEVRPRWVIVENSPRLRTRGGDRLLAELEGYGYTCWPIVVGARYVLAPHDRDRVWIVGHANCDRKDKRTGAQMQSSVGPARAGQNSYTERDGCGEGQEEPVAAQAKVAGSVCASVGREVADTYRGGLRNESGRRYGTCRSGTPESQDDVDANGKGESQQPVDGQVGGGEIIEGADDEPWDHWNTGPGAHLSMDDGLSVGMARRQIKGFGNAVVPVVVEVIGNAILAVERQMLFV